MAIAPPAPSTSPIVYLDNSALGRLTDLTPELAMEAKQVHQLIRECLAGRLRLLSSEVLELEVREAPEDVRTTSISILAAAWRRAPLAGTAHIARQLQTLHFHTNDALHIAAAYTGGADYAVSCDRQHWIRRAGRVAALLGPRPAIVTPEECLRREGLL
ncbi:MAG: hypothetical protein ACYDAG_08220 [Chloroflexota bacterium]